ncbi:MAG: nucleotidyltransferase family protein [Verrucomicrobiota bacterium]
MSKRHAFPVAILAGGLATRLRPITSTIPKAMVDVAGEPFIFRQLRYLKAQGIERVVLCVGYLGEQIQEAVGDGAAFGLRVDYSMDGPTLLGTAGALKRALPMLGPDFFVFYGDSYLPIDFAPVQQAYIEQGKPALMTVLRNNGQWDKSNVLLEGDHLVEYNKRVLRPEMEHIDYGLSILSSEALKGLPENQPADLADIFTNLSHTGQLAHQEVHQRFYEIGSPEGLAETCALFRE